MSAAHPRSVVAAAAVAVACLLAAACGNSIYTTSPIPPTVPEEADTQPRSPTPDVSVTSAGFAPQVLHVDAPVTVIFTNNDTVPHTLRNAPQLGWDDCAEMNEPLTLAPGEVGRVTFSHPDAVCTYVDVARARETAFQGYIALH
jgi:plastocyanin